MPNTRDSVTADLVTAVLRGGPATLPETQRRQRVPVVAEKIKIPHMGGYEHFHRESDDLDPAAELPLVFNWVMRTKVAE